MKVSPEDPAAPIGVRPRARENAPATTARKPSVARGRPPGSPRAPRAAGGRGSHMHVTVGELVDAVASLTDDTSELILAVGDILRSNATWERPGRPPRKPR